MANSVNPDQRLHFAASDLGLHCLPKTVCPNTKGTYNSKETFSISEFVCKSISYLMFSQNMDSKMFGL